MKALLKNLIVVVLICELYAPAHLIAQTTVANETQQDASFADKNEAAIAQLELVCYDASKVNRLAEFYRKKIASASDGIATWLASESSALTEWCSFVLEIAAVSNLDELMDAADTLNDMKNLGWDDAINFYNYTLHKKSLNTPSETTLLTLLNIYLRNINCKVLFMPIIQ